MDTLILLLLTLLLLSTIGLIAFLYLRRESNQTPPPLAHSNPIRRIRKPQRGNSGTSIPFEVLPALEASVEALTWQWDIVEEVEEVFTQPVSWATLFDVIPELMAHTELIPLIPLIPNDNPTTPLTLKMLGIIRCKRRDIGRKPVRDLPHVNYPEVDCSPFLLASTYAPVDVAGWLEHVIGPSVEIAIEPCQLDMTQEVQLRAIMPTEEPQSSVRAIEPDSEGIDASLIYASCNDRTIFGVVELKELADSIELSGLLQPITVRPVGKRFELVAGERRYRAMTEVLGWTTIPRNYVQVKTLTDMEASRLMFVENAKRKDLNPIDEANAYQKRIAQFGLSIQAVAKDASFPVERIKSRLSLLTLIDDAKSLMKSGNLGVGYGEAMSGLDVNRQAKALEYLVKAKRPSLSEFRELVNAMLEVQTQQSLEGFNIDDFIVKGAEAYAHEVAKKQARRFPVSDKLPAMPKAQSAGLAIEKFIKLLMDSESGEVRDAAQVVGAVYSGLLAQGHVKRPLTSPLDAATVELELQAA